MGEKMYIDYVNESKKFGKHKHTMPPDAKPPQGHGASGPLSGDLVFRTSDKTRRRIEREAAHRANVQPDYIRREQIRAIREEFGLAEEKDSFGY